MARLLVAVKRTMRRKQDDVFLLGDESLFAEQAATRNLGSATGDGQGAGGETPPASLTSPAHPGSSLPGARRLAVLGIGAAAAASFGALELTGGGTSHPARPQASARSPLIARSAASVPATPEEARPTVHSKQPSPRHQEARRRPEPIHHRKPEREPTAQEAPVGTPVDVSAPSPPPAPAPAPVPSPLSPSPAPTGGGSRGREQFGFER